MGLFSKLFRKDKQEASKPKQWLVLGFSANKGGSLREVDESCSKLFSAGAVKFAQSAIDLGDGTMLYGVLSQCYGDLIEVICLNGPFKARCILVFDEGVGLLAGSGSTIPILTFGYLGQGPTIMSAFLNAARFANANAEEFQPPVIVCRDGTTIKGIAEGSEISWEDGTKTVMPKFLGDR